MATGDDSLTRNADPENLMKEIKKLQYTLRGANATMSQSIITIKKYKSDLEDNLKLINNLVDEKTKNQKLIKELCNEKIKMQTEIINLKEKVEIMPALYHQIEVYKSDFEHERRAREELHSKYYSSIQECETLKKRHNGFSSPYPSCSSTPLSTPQLLCPKCNIPSPDIISLQEHVQDCLR